MIAIQLADLFTSEPPKAELREKFNQAASAISHSFTIKLTAEDEQYLYIRYKKLKHDTGLIEFLKRPYLIYAFYVSLFGYDDTQLMEQYIQRVEKLGIDIKTREKRSGFSKGPSKMQSSQSDEELSDKNAQLFDFIRNDDISEIRNLLTADPKLVNLPYLDMYPIHVAADLGKIEILQILIEFGANINQKDSDGQTALHYAASNGYFEAVQYLLSSGIDSNILCNENQTALDLATDIEIIKILKDAA